jgi:hypothetical protein
MIMLPFYYTKVPGVGASVEAGQGSPPSRVAAVIDVGAAKIGAL